ncbi:MAG: hypothetical protein JXR03_08735 [Cyclobacteriaceae bacterium]
MAKKTTKNEKVEKEEKVDAKGQVEGILSELGKKIDHLIVETKGAKDDVREEVENKIKELKNKKEKLEDDFKEYKDKEKWNDAKSHLSSAIDELKKALGAVIKK